MNYGFRRIPLVILSVVGLALSVQAKQMVKDEVKAEAPRPAAEAPYALGGERHMFIDDMGLSEMKRTQFAVRLAAMMR